MLTASIFYKQMYIQSDMQTWSNIRADLKLQWILDGLTEFKNCFSLSLEPMETI